MCLPSTSLAISYHALLGFYDSYRKRSRLHHSVRDDRLQLVTLTAKAHKKGLNYLQADKETSVLRVDGLHAASYRDMSSHRAAFEGQLTC
jgi:hypothetical protein